MALDFPSAPIVGATYTGPGGVVWAWDGAKWVNGTQIGTAYAPIDSPVLTGNPTAPNPPAGDADQSVATTSFVAAAVGTALHDVGRNLLHNGLFNIAQRGAGPWTGIGYTVDRWSMGFIGGTFSAQQIAQSDAGRTQIGDEASMFVLGVVCAGTAGAGDYAQIIQPIEGVRRLAGKTVTVSFWAAAGTAGTKIGVSLDQVFGTGGSPSAPVSLNGQSFTLTTILTRYSATFTLPSAAGKVIGSNGDDKTQLDFWWSSGATNNVRAGNIGVQTVNINLWGVQLELGSVATPLEKLDPRMDLANCQRFYQVGYGWLFGYSNAGTTIGYAVSLPVVMRSTPTTTLNGQSYTNASGLAVGSNSISVTLYAIVTVTGNAQFSSNFTASADL